MEYEHRNRGTCSMKVLFELEDGIVHNVRFIGGCSGNTQGVSKLCEGRKAEELVTLLRGIRCGGKPTSCPDQLAEGIEQALKG